MLLRFDPFREFDRLTEQLASTASRAPRPFPMDAYRRGDRFIVEFDLPGVEPASIELTVEQNVLTVRAERRFEPQEGDELVVAERPQGTYARQVFLGDTLDAEHVQADCQLGGRTRHRSARRHRKARARSPHALGLRPGPPRAQRRARGARRPRPGDTVAQDHASHARPLW